MQRLERKPVLSTDHLNILSSTAQQAARLAVFTTVIASGLSAIIDKSPGKTTERLLKGSTVVLGMAVIGAFCDKVVDKIHGNNLY